MRSILLVAINKLNTFSICQATVKVNNKMGGGGGGELYTLINNDAITLNESIMQSLPF